MKPRPGQTIAVFGTGAVGLAAMMAGKISGCTRVIAVDIVPSRLELAKELGAAAAINSKEEDPVEKIKELTDGYGVDYTVDTTGLPAVMKQGIDSLAQGGNEAAIAVTPHNIEFSTWNDLCTSDRKVVGINMGMQFPKSMFQDCLNSISLACLITKRLRSSMTLKILILPMVIQYQARLSSLF